MILHLAITAVLPIMLDSCRSPVFSIDKWLPEDHRSDRTFYADPIQEPACCLHPFKGGTYYSSPRGQRRITFWASKCASTYKSFHYKKTKLDWLGHAVTKNEEHWSLLSKLHSNPCWLCVYVYCVLGGGGGGQNSCIQSVTVVTTYRLDTETKGSMRFRNPEGPGL